MSACTGVCLHRFTASNDRRLFVANVGRPRRRLGTNLKKRRSEIVEAIAEIGSESQTASSQAADQDSSAATLERLEADLSNVLEESSSLEARQANLEIQMASAGEQRAKLKGRIEKLKKAESAREQEGAQQKMDSLLSKRSMLVTKKETSMRKIRELGSLPADAFKYDDASNAQLLKKLKKVRRAGLHPGLRMFMLNQPRSISAGLRLRLRLLLLIPSLLSSSYFSQARIASFPPSADQRS